MFAVEQSGSVVMGNLRIPIAKLMEKTMSHKSSKPVPTRGSGHAPEQTAPKPEQRPTEPVEVAGRHKNTGQKDHKGAR